jgi:hypothetical protein
MADNGYTPDGFCPKCAYQMSPGRCPECGTEVSVATLAHVHPRRKRRRLIIAAAVLIPLAILVSPCVLFLGVVSVDRAREYLGRLNFDARAWSDSAQLDQNVRIRMVDDLLARHPLRGLSREEVAGLLGAGDHTASFPNWALAYWLGRGRGFMAMDSEWLVIDFDEGGRVSKYDVVRDSNP